MTKLVGILSGGKIATRLTARTFVLFGLSLAIFTASTQIISAQGGGADSGQAANRAPSIDGGLYSAAVRANGNPGGVTTAPSPEVGRGNAGPGGPTTEAERAQARAAADKAQAEAIAAAEGLGSTPDGVLGLFHTYVLSGVGWVVGQAGLAFDYSINRFVIGFGDLYVNGNTGKTIDALWSTIRDIFNLTFIFGLVYIGFKMILDSSDSSARKMLVSLVGAALLVNFSLFITKFVVDFSNIAAAQIFAAFESSGKLSITGGFMELMGINRLILVKYTAGGSFAYIIGMLIVFATLAYVFIAGAVLIIIRFVVLNIYMVFSPLMFLGWVFPAMQGYSKDYWSGFLRQAFFAPAFIFMLYLSYKVAASFPIQRDMANMFNQNGSTVTDAPGLIPYFAMVMVFLCASMIVSRKMGAHGATMAVSVGNKLRGSVQSSIGRNTVGRGAEKFGKLNDRLEGSRTGRNFKRALSVASFGTLDERTRKNIAKAGTEAKFGGSYSRSDDKKFASELATTQAAGSFAQSVKSGLSASTAESQIKFEQDITNASTPQLIEQLGKHKDGSAAYGKIVQAMSHAQVTKLLDSKDEDFSPTKRNALAKARGSQVINRLTTDLPGQPGSAVTLPKAIAKASIEDLVAVGYDTLKTNAMYIPAAKMDDLKSKLTSTEHGLLTAERNKQLTESFVQNPNSIFKGKKDSEIARLPKDILIKPQAVIGLNQRVLEIILRENYLETSDRAHIRNNILGMTGPTSPMTKFLNSPIGLAF